MDPILLILGIMVLAYWLFGVSRPLENRPGVFSGLGAIVIFLLGLVLLVVGIF
jgi:hypothetical protein